jgi:hypothetical protein
MRRDAPFLVKGYGPLIGIPTSRSRITVLYQAYTLQEAHDWAQFNGGPCVWIDRREAPAWRRLRRPQGKAA